MDTAKSAMKSFVLDLRKALEAEIEVGLRRYGLAAGKWRDVSELKHLDDRGIADRIRMEEAIRHEMHRAGDKSGEAARAEAVRWFIREVAFTHLNRLVALKFLEVRGLIPEIIQPRPEYGNRSRAHRDYREVHLDEAAAPDDALEAAIKSICRTVYPEFRILFNVGDPAAGREPAANSLLWPSYPALKTCIAKINALDAEAGRPGPPAHSPATLEESVWAEDEIIGWIYQFYNAEEKKAIRQRGKPNHPAEVAVINQFFTPRWIVKFLVDNTLGRLWLEMHPESPRVRAKCDYLVPEPISPLPEGDPLTGAGGPGVRVNPQSPINDPSAPPRRPPKRPQDIRLIDPACGTMHFGHYAFEVFRAIYADAREQGWVTGDDALSDEDVPAAILRHNLYGVDIDLRAVQLAALSLFIKAKSANPQAKIDRVNLVVADAYLPDSKVREDFLKQYAGEPVIQRAFREVFESLNNVAEVGSLLRVEARFRQILEVANHPAANGGTGKKKSNGGLPQKGFAEIAPGWSAEHTIEQMLNHLREFARNALKEHDLNAQLFAAETEKSVALLDVFLHEYDVVVMNPPYNKPKEMLPLTQHYLRTSFLHGGNDLYAAFFERAYDLLTPGGYCGALTSRTFFFLATFEDFRRQFLIPLTQLWAIADLGFGMLDDAAVETCATVFERQASDSNEKLPATFLRLLDVEDKEQVVSRVCKGLSIPNHQHRVFVVSQDDFTLTPRCSLAYWASHSLLELFSAHAPFRDAFGDVCMGLSTANDERFLRYIWETSEAKPTSTTRWVLHAKGGEFSRYYQDVYLVVDWLDNGRALAKSEGAVIRNARFYFKEGLTYPHDTVKGLNVRYLPSGATFGAKGPGIFVRDPESLWFALGYLNSALAQQLMLLMTPSRSWEVGLMQLLPCKVLSNPQQTIVAVNSQAIFAIKAAWDTGNETCTRFDAPWTVQAHRGTLFAKFKDLPQAKRPSNQLDELLEYVFAVEQAADARLQALQSQIDEAVYDLYEISTEDRALIERDLGERPVEIVWPYAEKLTREQKAAEHVARLMSYFLLEAIKADSDGILPITEGTRHTTALRAVHAGLEKEFGEAAAYQIETDAAAYLGRLLADWLMKDFWKNYHLRWYKNRPILWQLQSAKGHFACFVYIHKMNRETLPRVRTHYLWPARNALQGELDAARAGETTGKKGAAPQVAKLEAALDDLAAFEKALVDVIEARVRCEIPDWAEGPYRNGAYDPVLDDGVAVNILPLQMAGLLAKNKVV